MISFRFVMSFANKVLGWGAAIDPILEFLNLTPMAHCTIDLYMVYSVLVKNNLLELLVDVSNDAGGKMGGILK